MTTKYALALGGGGARGSYQIGVWKALKEMGIEIPCVAGTSVGAINGAIMVMDQYEYALDVWENLDYSAVIHLYKDQKEKESFKINAKDIVDYIKNISEKKGLDITPLRKLLHKDLNEETIRDSKIDYALVTVSISEMKPTVIYKKDIPKGKLVDYILASASFPIFERETIDGKQYIDGGLYDNMPINALIDKGYKNIIAVELTSLGINQKVKRDDVDIIHIKSSEYLGGILDFSPGVAKKNITLGYLDAKRKFHQYTGKNYFIKDDKNTLLYPINENEINLLFGENGMQTLRNPWIRNMVLKNIRQYTDGQLNQTNTLIGACEIAAELLGIDHLREYSPDELAEEVLKKYNEIKEEQQQYATVKDMVSDLLINGKELPQKWMMASMPKYYIANMFVYLILNRMDDNEKNGGQNE